MKNKNNILVRVWRAIFCVDYIENYNELQRKAEEEPEEPEMVMTLSTEYETDTAMRILGDNHLSWRLNDSWPAHVISGENAPKVVLLMNARTFMFHVSTWAAVNGKNIRDLCVTIRETMDPNTYRRWYTGILLLPEGNEAEEFKLWWTEYLDRFGIDKDILNTPEATTMFPELNEGDMLSGAMCKHAGMQYSERLEAWNPGKRMFEQWCWLVERCTGKIWVTPTHFIFEEPTDAVLYKLSNVDKEEK